MQRRLPNPAFRLVLAVCLSLWLGLCAPLLAQAERFVDNLAEAGNRHTLALNAATLAVWDVHSPSADCQDAEHAHCHSAFAHDHAYVTPFASAAEADVRLALDVHPRLPALSFLPTLIERPPKA